MLTVETLDYDHACTRVLIRCLSDSRSAKGYAHQTREAEEHAKSRAESTTSSLENETTLASPIVPHA